ncbi:MAG: malectin domain-containing carbohydrate-binding protein [Candidatus Sumerlaeota bacterium]
MKMRILILIAVLSMVVMLSGCAMLGGPSEPEYVVRVNAGAYESYTDESGNVWLADQDMQQGAAWGAIGGSTVMRDPQEIADTQAPQVYLTERFGMDSYEFTVPADNKYKVCLHFAETFDGIFAEGERVFEVKINDGEAMQVDPFKEGGGLFKPVTKCTSGVEPIDGKITISFIPDIQNPVVNGIVIMSE